MGDVTQEVADKQLQSFSNQIALTRAQFTNIGLTIGEALAGPLRQFNLWLREQTPAIEAWVENAIPAIERWFVQANEKFQQFKTSFQTNVIDPLNEFLARETTIAFFDEFEAEFQRLTARIRTLGEDLKAAVEAEDPNAIGMVLGEFVAEIFRTAFGRAEVIGEAIKQAFGGQDWTEIGKAVGAVAVDFFKGFVIGMFSKPEEVEGEFDQQSKTIASRLANNFVSTMIGAFILARVPLVGGIFRGMFGLMRAGFMRFVIAPFLGWFGWSVPATLTGGILKAIGAALTGVAAGIGGLFVRLAGALAGGIRVMFALFGGSTTASAMMTAETIRTFFASKWIALIRSGFFTALGGFIRTAVVAVGRAVVAIAAGFFGWPAVLAVAAAAAFAAFISRFARWNEEQGHQYEGFGAKIVAFIGQGITKMKEWFMETVGKWFGDRWQETKNLLAKLPWAELGGDIIDGLVKGIKDGAIRLKDSLVNAAEDAWQATKDFFQSRSPSRLFAGLGGDLMLGMAQGIDRSAKVVTDAMRDVSMDTAGVRFDAPQVPSLSRDGAGQQPIIINVTGALDAEGVARQIERILRDSQRRTGGVLI